ncbi:MAG: 50S ribosomal protein L25 [Succinivibrionaceae bacterium]|nr:50S ribosomal protein L25 [Succinivibrionaceae bacterium]
MAITLNAKVRTENGRGASRRLRRDGQIPAIVAAKGDEGTISIALDEKKLILAMLKDEFYKDEVTLEIEGRGAIKVKPVEAQRHPVSSRVIHLDFQRL